MNDKCKEEFLKHCQLWRYNTEIDEFGFYAESITQRVWDAFQRAWIESRKAIVVKLPHEVYKADIYVYACTEEVSYCWENYYEIQEVQDALKIAGVSYE